MAVPASSVHNGWHWDPANSRLNVYYRGTRLGHFNTTSLNMPVGNLAIGNPGAFATTQPQGAVVMGGSSLSGVAPAGAITTAGAIFASDTAVRKIIAGSTVSNVET